MAASSLHAEADVLPAPPGQPGWRNAQVACFSPPRCTSGPPPIEREETHGDDDVQVRRYERNHPGRPGSVRRTAEAAGCDMMKAMDEVAQDGGLLVPV